MKRNPDRRRSAALLAGAAIALAGALAAPPARATGDPTLSWWTVETAHFRIHFHSGLEPIAKRIAQVAEAAHARLIGPLAYAPSVRTEVVLTDDSESANGSATALPYNQIALYVTAPDDFSPLNDYDDWYLGLVTHEYTHILHVDNITGPAAVLNAILGKTYSPNQAQPRWIIEGLAVLTESGYSSGGRLRSSIFDMYLRADVLEDNIAELDVISGSPQRWPQGSIFYLYGSRFLSWIADTYGFNVLRAVSQDYGGTTLPWGINRAIRRQTGRTYVELYEGFKDHVRRQYKEQMRKVTARGIREGTPITTHGYYAYYPRFVPRAARSGEAEEIVYYKDDLDAREGLYKIPLDVPAGKKERPEELLTRVRGDGVISFTSSGDAYFTNTSVWKNFYSRYDIFKLPKGERAPRGDEPRRLQVTHGQRAQYVDVRPDGKQMVFTVNARGTSFLEIAEIADDGSIKDKRDLAPSRRFEQVYTPRYSPDGSLVAYSQWREGGYRDVHIVDVATGKIKDITSDRALDMQPVFSPDQKTLYFVSDRTGIPNVYAYDLGTGGLKQVTNVRTGAFAPTISDDGKTMVYMGYTSRGFDLYRMPIDPSRFLDATPPPADRPDPFPPTVPVAMTLAPYDPLPTLRPHNFFLEIAPGQYSDTAISLTTSGSDIVGLHNISLRVTADPKAPSPEFSASYNYNRLPFNVGVRGFHSVTPRSGYVVSDKPITVDEYATGVTTGVSLPIYDDFAQHSLGLSYSVAAYSAKFPVPEHADPFGKVTVKPREGMFNVLHAGYSYSSVEYGLRTPGIARGVTLSLGVDYAGLATGSVASTYAFEAIATGYIPIPWPSRYLRYHTLALRAAGGITGGDLVRGNAYFVGGYNLEKHDLPDTILSGIFNGAFVLRGYPPSSFGGKEYVLGNAEYRFPIAVPDKGIATLPVYLQRIDGNLFMDAGGAFNDLDIHRAALFRNGRFIDSDLFHASFGAELWFGISVGYGLYAQLRLGWARGVTPDALSGGQWYFVASSAY